MTSEGRNVKNGMRVEVVGKGLVGTVAFVGATQFAAGTYRTLEFYHFS